MIIVRTPYRISFFGGGTDYPDWYLQNGGQVLSTTINRYCYLTMRYLPPFFDHKMRIVYSKIELCKSIDEIQHPLVREALRHVGWTTGLELHHDGDLPARSGMGSSSAFTVGLLNGLYALKGIPRSTMQLVEESIHVERNLAGDIVGSQDQSAVAHGGLNHIVFHQNGAIEVQPLVLKHNRIHALHSHLLLFFTGICRDSSLIAKAYSVGRTQHAHLRRIHTLTDEALAVLNSDKNICEFGELLRASWLEKRGFCDDMTPPGVQEAFECAHNAGALGGKILGAGGGGFVLFFVPPARHDAVRRALKTWLTVPFAFSNEGSRIIFQVSDTASQEDCGVGVS